jgi:hypothetical protein
MRVASSVRFELRRAIGFAAAHAGAFYRSIAQEALGVQSAKRNRKARAA